MPSFTVLRVDPDRRTIAAMSVRSGKNVISLIRRLLRVRDVGYRDLLQVDGITMLVVMAGTEVSEDMNGWRLRGGEDTAGVSVLFGRTAVDGGLTGVPVTRAWLEERIEWLAGEDAEAIRNRAVETLPMLDDAMRGALKEAMPSVSDGALWLTLDASSLFEAARGLGITTAESGGQKLSRMGEALHEIIVGEEA